MPALIQATGACAQLNTAWNTRNSSTASSMRTDDRIHHDRIEARQRAIAQRLDVAGSRENAARLALRRGELAQSVVARQRERCACGAPTSICIERRHQRRLAAGTHRHGLAPPARPVRAPAPRDRA